MVLPHCPAAVAKKFWKVVESGSGKYLLLTVILNLKEFHRTDVGLFVFKHNVFACTGYLKFVVPPELFLSLCNSSVFLSLPRHIGFCF